MWKRDFAYCHAVLPQVAYGRFGCGTHFAVELLPKIIVSAAQAKFAERLAKSGAEIFHATCGRCRVEGVPSSEQVEQDCGVGNAVREGTDVIEAWRERNRAKYAHASESRLEPHDSTHRCGNPNRAAGVRTDRRDRETR